MAKYKITFENDDFKAVIETDIIPSPFNWNHDPKSKADNLGFAIYYLGQCMGDNKSGINAAQ